MPGPGSIAFTGFNADGNDDVSFVVLEDLPAGTVIYFTDNEWNGTAFTDAAEGRIALTLTSAVSAGTIITLSNLSTGATTSHGTLNVTAAINLNANDEVLYAYVANSGTPTVPTAFLSAIANGGFSAVNGVLTGTGLTAGVDAVNVGLIDDDLDVAAYTGARSGSATFADYRAIINNASNWIAQDGTNNQNNDGIAPDTPFSTTAFTVTAAATQPGALAIADQAVTEGNSGTTDIVFTVTRSGGSDGAIGATYTVSFAAGSGNADAADFAAAQALTGTVSFAAGETSKTITLQVQGDTTIEPNEAFTVTLSNPTGGATLSDAVAAGTINNDDFPPVPGATIADATIVEGDSGQQTMLFTVTLAFAASGPVTIDYATSNGSAATGSDFVASTGQVSFAAGETSKTISVPILGDAVAELTETFTVTLSNPSGATLTDGSAVGTITDNDGPIYHALSTGSLSQNWSNTSLISADDDWSNVPSIIGYRGDDLTTATGTNPQTITGTSSVVDVIANQTSTALGSGGVAEFELADPTIALQGSGTADAPYIELFLNSVGRDNITVSYRLRDLEATADNAVQQVALQYRVGTTGPWIDVPTAFVTDATTGPNTAGPDILVSAVLPVDAENREQLQVRIITTNAVSNDEWVGIDDIVVTSDLGQPTLAIADASVTEGNAGTTPITFTVTRFGDPAGAVTADWTVSFGSDSFSAGASDFAGNQPLSGTVSFADGETSKTITLAVAGDVAPEGTETFTVALSNVSGGSLLDAAATGTIVNDDGAAPSLAISDVTQVEGNAGTTTFIFTVSRTGGTGAVTVDYATANGTATAGEDYASTSGTLSFAPEEMSRTVSVTVSGDAAGEPNETFEVRLSNPTGFAIIADGTGIGTIANDDPIFIHDIQGTAYYSPILAAEGKTGFNIASTTTVIVRAVVTAVDNDGQRQGYYITEELADWDGNAYTSEGIFVMTRNDAGTGSAVTGVNVGDLVQVTAQVMEYQSFNTMPRTVLVNATTSVLSTANPLPTLILDAGHPIPNSIMTAVTPDYTDSADGAGDTFDASLYGLSFWETVEGMLVTIPDMVVADGFVQTSGGQPYFQAYSALHADADQINSRGGLTVAGDPPFSPPDTPETDDGTIAGGRHLHDGDVNPDIIEVDFSGFAIDAPAGLAQNATMGDRLGDVTGIVEFDFTDRKLFVTNIDAGAITDGIPTREVTVLGDDSRSLTVATFNVENLDPGDGAARFAALAGAIANNLGSPDIISIEEMQDNNGATSTGGADASTTWQMLVDALNSATGKHYQWVDQEPVPGAEGGEPGGNIRVGFLYDTDRVQLGDLSADATLAERRQFTDRVGDGVRDAGDRIAYSDDMIASEINPGDWTGTRLSLLAQFTFQGHSVFVTANHFPAKGGSGEFWQFNQNIAAGDPDNSGWAKRNAVANDVYTMLSYIETHAQNAGVVAGGDFNDFYFYRPLEIVTGYVNVDGTPRDGGVRFDNLTVTELTEAERYSYTFDGRSQAIDHVIVNAMLSSVATYDIVHINTGFNPLGNNPALSDHDPAIASFDFRAFAETLVGTDERDALEGFGGDDVLIGKGGNDFLDGGTGADQMTGGEGNDSYLVDDKSDRVIEVVGGGYDRVYSSVSYTLAGDTEVELLATTNSGSEVGVTLKGNDFTQAVIGTAGNDALYGFAGDDYLRGLGGQDVIDGGAGADVMEGGAGDDIYFVQDAGDVIWENDGEGTDWLYTSVSYALGVSAFVEQIATTDSAGTSAIDLAGSNRDNTMIGNDGANVLTGGGGNDHITGRAGDDLIDGGAGQDILDGGAGADRFRFEFATDSAFDAADSIRGFTVGEDRIDVSLVDADETQAGYQGFTWIGSDVFSGKAGELRVEMVGDTAHILGDTDGDGQADFYIVAYNTTGPVTQTDFIF